MNCGTLALLRAIAVAVLALPSWTLAQSRAEPARVAILSTASESAAGDYIRRFVGEMEQLGWQSGRNVVYESRFADGNHGKLPVLTDEVIASRPDLILATTTYVAQALKPRAAHIPIVLATSLDLVSQGLVASLSRPGGNITGMSIVGEAFHAKLVELASTLLPAHKRVAVLFNPERVLVKAYVEGTIAAGKALGVDVIAVFAGNAGEIQAAFAAGRQRADVLVVVPDTLFVSLRTSMIEQAAKARWPLIGPISEYAQQGALASYGANIPATYARAAHFADKILRGAKAGDLPIEQVSQFELVVNLKTAKALGIAIPPAVLIRADRVIE